MTQDSKEKAGKRNGQMMKISFISLLVVLLFMIEMYEIINDPANMVVIGSLGAFLLVSVYVEMLFISKYVQSRAQEQEEAFDHVYRSEKASYLLMRKNFDQMDQKMDSLGDLSNIPYKELIAAQKALAKAQINRNKQNTNALLISNDRMMQKLTGIHSDISDILTNTASNAVENNSEINTGLSEQDKAVFLEGNQNVLEKQQEILQNLKELESSLRNEILESADKLASIQSQQIEVPQPQMQIGEAEDEILPLDIDDLTMPEPQMQVKETEDEILPLDIEDDFSLDSIEKPKSKMEKSSESNLDRLLQQMNVSDILEPELPSINEDTEPHPIITESELQPIADEPELEPIEDEPDLQLSMSEPELQPITNELELQSIIAEPELQPITNEPELQSIIAEQELQPIANEPELQSVIAEPELQPIINEPELQPVIAEPELQSITEEPELQSMIEEPELQPAMSESIAEIPELQPAMSELQLDPIAEAPELQPVMPEPELQSVIEEEPELQSLRMEPEGTDQPDIQTEAEHSESAADTSEAKSREKSSISETLNAGQEITPDQLAAMVANLGTDIKMEPEPEIESKDTAKNSFMAQTFEPALEPIVQNEPKQNNEPKSSEDDLEQIMKALDINDISENSLEDLDIDKILEIPAANGESGSANTNQVMSSEEIAALIANTDLLSEPETTNNNDMMDLSDPGHMMSSDEIAALIANM